MVGERHATFESQSLGPGTAWVAGPQDVPFHSTVCGAAGVAMQNVGEVHESAEPPSVPVVWPETRRQEEPFQVIEPTCPPRAIQNVGEVHEMYCTSP